MYKAIRSRASSTQLYGDSLQEKGILTKEWREGLAAKLHAHLDKEFTAASEVRGSARSVRHQVVVDAMLGHVCAVLHRGRLHVEQGQEACRRRGTRSQV